ncbi:SHOCT domain-containing protein [Flagellimonas profundi]|uniref:SHOCT domain-containing protein n=1 Tax=Flagellimonas profundi TaxID=2915620 RepID=A0ABS3FDM9_9FLAO|nr:SHOCT domain-containing protein [Allomuricauda profundi]MBO0341047.1 SHOCT domain-containing protein [Allomuricauda profundi]
MHDFNWHNWGSGMMWFIWIPLILVGVWIILKLMKTNGFNEQKKESPLEILKRRYANGEISTQEYEQRKKMIEKD